MIKERHSEIVDEASLKKYAKLVIAAVQVI